MQIRRDARSLGFYGSHQFASVLTCTIVSRPNLKLKLSAGRSLAPG